MATKRQTTDSAATAADTTDNTPAADTTPASVLTEGMDITSIEIAPAAKAALREQTDVDNIEAALKVLAADSPAYAALEAALDVARGALALAQAEVTRQAEKTAEIAAATAAAANLPPELLTAMLAAIEAKYAYVPRDPAQDAAAAAADAPYIGRKVPGARTLERNAAALAQAAVDPSVGMRCAATYNAFTGTYAGDLKGVSAQAGTRYVSIVAFAGDGVANAADYRSLVPQLRQYLLGIGLAAGGDSAATDAWLFAFGPHAPGAPKSADTLRLKFRSGAGVALFPDGRFRLATPGTAGARFVAADAQAFAIWRGVAAPAAPAPTTPAADAPTSPAAPAQRKAPTPPNAAALPNGTVVTGTARCQHCAQRNVVGELECSHCGATDWSD